MITKLARVSRRVTKLSYSCWTTKKPRSARVSKTIQRGTMKYLPFIVQTIQTQQVDIRSVENATFEILGLEVLTLMIHIAVVLCRQELKNMSKTESSRDGP